MNVMKSTILIFCVLISGTHNAVAQYCLWAQRAGGSGPDIAEATATDRFGNVYVTGIFSSSTITFGSYTLTDTNATSGIENTFLVKYDEYGDVLWAKSSTGRSEGLVHSIAVDGAGNVYLTGNFNGVSISFDTVTLYNTDVTGAGGGANVFLVKYDSSGQVQWGRSAGDSISYNESWGVAADAWGGVYVTGFFGGPVINFGGYTLTNPLAAEYDIYFVKYDIMGNVRWAQRYGGINPDIGYAVTTDSAGSVYLAGNFGNDTMSFGATTLVNTGVQSVFLTKFDTSGAVHWAKCSEGGSGAGFCLPTSLTTDKAGNVLMAGSYSYNTMAFDTATLISANGASDDAFLVKYDSTGALVWARSAGGANADRANGVATDDSGYVLITGYFGSTSIAFDTSVLTNTQTDGSTDIFVTKYDAWGNVAWTKSTGATGFDAANGITEEGHGIFYVAGSFAGSSIAFGAFTLSFAGGSDVFVAKYGWEPTAVSGPAAAGSRVVALYPNPTNRMLSIASRVGDLGNLTVYDCMGQVVKSLGGPIREKDAQIDISVLNDGIYWLEAVSNAQVARIPFEVRH